MVNEEHIQGQTSTTTTWSTGTLLPTKKEIIQRLFEAKHINFDEMWVLLQEKDDIRYYYTYPVYPYPVWNPWPVTISSVWPVHIRGAHNNGNT